MITEIKLSSSHILTARPQKCGDCPVAKALADGTGAKAQVGVYSADLYYGDDENGRPKTSHLNVGYNLGKSILTYDEHKHMEPGVLVIDWTNNTIDWKENACN